MKAAVIEVQSVRPGADVPASLQAYRILSRAIRLDRPTPGSRVPSERHLAEALGVSRVTVRKVLFSLADEGVLESSAQRGWFIPEAPLSEPPNTLQSFTEMATARGFQVETQVLMRKVRPATLDEAEHLGLAPTSPILELERLRKLDGNPICVDHSRLSAARVEAIVGLDLTDCSLYAALEDRCGIVPSRADYSVHAEPASAQVAKWLGLEPGAPVLAGSETTYDQDDAPIAFGELRYRGDAYRFNASLFRI